MKFNMATTIQTTHQGRIQRGTIGAIAPLKPTKVTPFTMISYNSVNSIRDIRPFCCPVFRHKNVAKYTSSISCSSEPLMIHDYQILQISPLPLTFTVCIHPWNLPCLNFPLTMYSLFRHIPSGN